MWLAEQKYEVVSETDPQQAAILLTQGIEPSHKPQIAPVGPDGFDYQPGRGVDREGLYVAYPTASSPGSFGGVRLHLTLDKEQLGVPPELTQRGYNDDHLDFALGTSDGAVTKGKIPKSVFTAVEVYRRGKWKSMTPEEYLKAIGIGETPTLPTSQQFLQWLQSKADEFYLSPDKVDQVARDYNRSSLADKMYHAQDAGLI